MLRLLKAGKASGVIIHKIDRSARNLRDWADLGELIDGGIEVYFANESLDLRSRGGRLAADIQAVVASDFIRNLREETKKGFYGRLKQGLLPMPAPLGYLNVGKGELKIIDPTKAPLVRKAFELYATAEFSLDQLVKEMHRRGLRSRKGRKVGRNSMSLLLNRPYYVGEIEIKKTGERFLGGHEPIVAPEARIWTRGSGRWKISSELAGNAYLLYKSASKEKKRELVENLTSNRSVKQKSIGITLNPAALAIAGRPKYADGSPARDTTRTKRRFLWKLIDLLRLPPAMPAHGCAYHP
jgi:hypothetical protein